MGNFFTKIKCPVSPASNQSPCITKSQSDPCLPTSVKKPELPSIKEEETEDKEEHLFGYMEKQFNS